MTSLRPSVFNQREREDGGPFLVIKPAESEDDGVYVFFTDIAPEQLQLDSPIALLLHVCPNELTIWPLNVRADSDDYLQPKYNTLESITVARRVTEPYALPSTTDDVEELLEQLPEGFSKDFRFGLGLLWEYRKICETIARIHGVKGLIIHQGNEAKIDPPQFFLGITRFHNLRKELKRITSRYQRDARKEKEFSTYQTLLHARGTNNYANLPILLVNRQIRFD